VKNFIERHTFLGNLARQRRARRFKKKYEAWLNEGAVLPMPHYGKQMVVKEYAETFRPEVFIETGTYTGHMVYAMLDQFKEIYSIELDRCFMKKAKKKYAGYDYVHIIHGQSGERLRKILKNLNKSCLFWLDAHWSGGATARGNLETPIIQELETILNHQNAANHILLIDDARCFTGENDYPSLDTLKSFVLHIRPSWIFQVKDDIIRTHSDHLGKGIIPFHK